MSDTQTHSISTVDEVKAHFSKLDKVVLTFVGYSGLGYEDEEALEKIVINRFLKTLDPKKTLINVGVTPDGIGAVYEWASKMGFETTGIVSSQALEYGVDVSPFVKNGTFFIEDETWGGYLEGTEKLSPTSEAMVSVSHQMIAIGGGEVALDEMREMKKRNKTITYIPAEMNHEKAQAKAAKKGDPAPTSFWGPLESEFEASL
tara:strand:- start:6161 stop:6769 length:609 start_codon:yes stop_codon:yes gene_type:complete